MKERFVSFPLSNKCLALTTTTELGNLAYQVDEGKGVKDRRILLADLIHIPMERFVFVHQHHSDIIQEVEREKNSSRSGENTAINHSSQITPASMTSIMQRILAFPIESKSPLESMAFLAEVKQQLAMLF